MQYDTHVHTQSSFQHDGSEAGSSYDVRLAGLPLQTLATKKDKHENFNIYELNKTSHVIVNLLVWIYS